MIRPGFTGPSLLFFLPPPPPFRAVLFGGSDYVQPARKEWGSCSTPTERGVRMKSFGILLHERFLSPSAFIF